MQNRKALRERWWQYAAKRPGLDAAIAGAALYDGHAGVSFGGGLFAVPIRSLWETT